MSVIEGSSSALLLATLALLSIGLCIANVVKTHQVAQVIGALCLYSMMFFSRPRASRFTRSGQRLRVLA
jgi:hypothetical protein